MLPSQAEFSVSYDRTTRIISTIVAVLLFALPLIVHRLIAICIPVLILALAYGWSPAGYAISGHAIIVRRLIGNVRFRLEDVREARRAATDDFSGTIRLCGSGGVFGYYGLFRTSKLGKCWWYLTNRSNATVVITRAKTAVFSPDDVDAFLAAVRSQARP
jgi:hypothetical protein